jgi:phosphoribosyl 1,2-cyclic phosphodiesterase
MIRVCSLGSGSGGNATLVEASDGTTRTRVLVDCGFSARELTTRLAKAGLVIADLDAVFVTHEHGDHVGCAVTLARRHGRALWMSRGTWRAIGEPDEGLVNFARDGQAIALRDLELRPYTVPHDAQEPLQLCFADGRHRFGMLTDAGSITPHLLESLAGADALLLECNHDRDLLAGSRYHPSLKRRIGGRLGHLSNDTAGRILSELAHERLQFVVAAHLSAENNRPELAQAAIADAVGASRHDTTGLHVAGADWGFDWLSLA